MGESGTFTYPDGSTYTGQWNEQKQRHGYGRMKFIDGSQYCGHFGNGLFSGRGVLIFKDNSRFEGDFTRGKFNGYGIFSRCDNMKYEGQFQDGKMKGLGLITFSNNSHGLPRNEGYFEGNKIIRREKCPAVILKANTAASEARSFRV